MSVLSVGRSLAFVLVVGASWSLLSRYGLVFGGGGWFGSVGGVVAVVFFLFFVFLWLLVVGLFLFFRFSLPSRVD